ncbi:astacin-like metalloendopeptidase isoform X2 [Ascaphus truei]|uniref:astacin-like metalloendopeptidase isoform X2 n=1 Tax=Ascaphus truei TaxID=8439 RepID=UPI003F59A558
MHLSFLLLTNTLVKVCAGDPAQIPRERLRGSGHSDPSDDVFSDILTSNQGSSQIMIQGDIAIKKTRNALNCPGKTCLWPRSGGGLVHVPYIMSDNYTSVERKVIRAAMDEVMVLTCIRFTPRTREPDYLRIRPRDGCWSYIGRVGGAQDVSLMKSGCLHRGIIQHELLHALGFQHEQCRSDRDKYIRINWINISQDKERNFYKMSTQNLGVPYDYLSVLHYGKFAFASDAGKPTLEPTGNPSALIGQRVGLSSLDVVKMNKLYKCSVCSFLLPDPNGGISWESALHPNTSSCVWLIRVPEGKVFLQFEAFDIPSSPACGRGFVKVHDGPSSESPLLLPKTCGKTWPVGLVASSNLVKVEFVSNGVGVSFRAKYDFVKCGGSITSPAGNFSSPGFPAKYPNSVDCVWILWAPPGNKITLHVEPFSLESSPGCSYDYFLLRDGRRQKKQCGPTPLLDVTSSSRSLLIHFHSDSSVQAPGFLATHFFTPVG